MKEEKAVTLHNVYQIFVDEEKEGNDIDREFFLGKNSNEVKFMHKEIATLVF